MVGVAEQEEKEKEEDEEAAKNLFALGHLDLWFFLVFRVWVLPDEYWIIGFSGR